MVLRTETVFVDRSIIRVALQLNDVHKNPQVSTDGLSVELVASLRGSNVKTSCNSNSFGRADHFYIQHCLISSLPSTWFTEEDEIIVVAEVRYAGYELFASSPAVVRVVPRPSWYSSLSLVLPRAGAFATLPVCPVYKYEGFDVNIYAHTGGYALETWWILVDIDKSLLEFVSFSQNNHFNGVTFTTEEVGDDLARLGFSAVGTKGTTQAAYVTGNAVPLVVITLRFKIDVSPGRHANVLSIFTRQFINPASNPFVVDVSGVVADAISGSNGNQTGSMWVREVTDIALFAYMPQGTLSNFAPLTGENMTYPMTIVKTNDDDRIDTSSTSIVSTATCSPVTTTYIFVLEDCTVLFTAQHNESAAFVSVDVRYMDLQ
eukprot:4824511-Pleurochrysis_carterae.AAC.1